ncbi:hypothetical protein [Pyrobaculum sp.]|uniref:hypothetical protein n=1 Tax=Pyrobaculum sp. TaxID=2004705 RepID=UPI003D104DB3
MRIEEIRRNGETLVATSTLLEIRDFFYQPSVGLWIESGHKASWLRARFGYLNAIELGRTRESKGALGVSTPLAESSADLDIFGARAYRDVLFLRAGADALLL